LQQKRPTGTGRATICNRQNEIMLMFAIRNESPRNIRHPVLNCKQKSATSSRARSLPLPEAFLMPPVLLVAADLYKTKFSFHK